MRPHTTLSAPASSDPDAAAASSRAMRGAAIGAAKFLAVTLPLGFVLKRSYPLYRHLTIQFRVFLHMSGMVLGGAVTGDRRMREWEAEVRRRRRMGKRKDEGGG
ncbi:hypothetical protein MMC20_006756 [Loxospora ochrophaea]|nr:hypothetical protein [Loxospora ochrophaea]